MRHRKLPIALLVLCSLASANTLADKVVDPALEQAIVQVLNEETAHVSKFMTCAALDPGMTRAVEQWWNNEMLSVRDALSMAKKPLSAGLIGEVIKVADAQSLYDHTMSLEAAAKLCAYPIEESAKHPLYRVLVFDFPRPAERILELVKAAR